MDTAQSFQIRNVVSCDLKHIAIIGGGTAGWMAAATLRRRLGCKVTLIESSQVPTIGVGEATIPSLVDWLENMGIDEEEFLRRTGGTYKLGIRFDQWVTPHHRYWHPFGICGVRMDGLDFVHVWKRGLDEGWLASDTQYTDFSLQKQLCDGLRCPNRPAHHPNIANYAFHLEASRLAKFLREIATAEGVMHRIGDVAGVARGENGEITQVYVKEQEPIEADLYIDCTGFAAVLCEKALGVRWLDWSNQLLCDRAVVTRTGSRTDNPNPYTVSTGLEAGWAWEIPLAENTGVGYVYSSKYTSSERARETLLQHAGLDLEETITRELCMRIGRREQSWVSNCVAIGLSAGFIEPLESTGIFLVQRALDDLVDCLELESPTTDPRSEFNRRMQIAYEEIRDFVLLHYVVSERTDTAFWRDARTVELPESLAYSIEQYDALGKVVLPTQGAVFAEANHHFIMTGAGRIPGPRMPTTTGGEIAKYSSDDLRQLCDLIRGQNEHVTGQMPRHHEAIASIHHPFPLSPSAIHCAHPKALETIHHAQYVLLVGPVA